MAAEKKTVEEQLDLLAKTMKEAALLADENVIGVHPHVVGCWVRGCQAIRDQMIAEKEQANLDAKGDALDRGD